jgi:uncharacterized cupin superfamily protein
MAERQMTVNETILENSMRLAGRVALNPSPIYPSWVIEGNPIARNKVLSSSADGTASTLIWDCTAGRFNWFYDVDETVYVIEGGMVIRDITGTARRLGAGDSIFFPAGTRAEWHVEKYIRKIAFCRTPLPAPLVFFNRGMRFLKRVIGSRGAANAAPAMFQSR